MPLTFNVEKIHDHQTRCWTVDDHDRQHVNVVTEALVFHTMTVGINEITAANVDEFTARVVEYESVVGPSISSWPEEEPAPVGRPITREDVEAHIGLHTNASRLGKRDWKARMKQVRSNPLVARGRVA